VLPPVSCGRFAPAGLIGAVRGSKEKLVSTCDTSAIFFT
jgi:hypothetical protein